MGFLRSEEARSGSGVDGLWYPSPWSKWCDLLTAKMWEPKQQDNSSESFETIGGYTSVGSSKHILWMPLNKQFNRTNWKGFPSAVFMHATIVWWCSWNDSAAWWLQDQRGQRPWCIVCEFSSLCLTTIHLRTPVSSYPRDGTGRSPCLELKFFYPCGSLMFCCGL